MTGSRQDDSERRYLHRGIATRAFERQFQLADYVTVTNASLVDGLLKIDLRREVPEEIKPRKIEIGDVPETPQRHLANNDDDREAA